VAKATDRKRSHLRFELLVTYHLSVIFLSIEKTYVMCSGVSVRDVLIPYKK
jgi:hypothetical protein